MTMPESKGQDAKKAVGNRGHRAPPQGNGEVTGSGAGAGVGGSPEDFDSDPNAGGGELPTGRKPPNAGK